MEAQDRQEEEAIREENFWTCRIRIDLESDEPIKSSREDGGEPLKVLDYKMAMDPTAGPGMALAVFIPCPKLLRERLYARPLEVVE